MDGCMHTKPVKFLIESVNPIQWSLNGTFNKQVSNKTKGMHLLSNMPKVTFSRTTELHTVSIL